MMFFDEEVIKFEIESKLDCLLEMVKKWDCIVVYFLGYGLYGKNNKLYFFFYDVNYKNIKWIVICMDDLVCNLGDEDEIKVYYKLFIVDVCKMGKLLYGMLKGGGYGVILKFV